ncbi:MAG: DNA polymerase III subunit delta [Gemmatimonadales bacterium]
MAASLSFDTAYRQVKRGELAPVYYITGDEDILKDELITLIRDRAVQAASRDFNLDTRVAGDVNGETFTALVDTPPVLSDRRVVVLKNLEHWRRNAKVWEAVRRYLQNPSQTTVLVLVHGAGEKPNRDLAGASVHVQVAPLSPQRTARWVKARASSSGLTLDADAARHLIDAVGGDLSLLAIEIEKLAAALAGRTAGARDVADFVGIRRGETPQDWVGAVLRREVPRAVEMLERVLMSPGVSGVRLVAMLGTALVGVRLARSSLDAGLSPQQSERRVFEHIRRSRPPGLRDWSTEARNWVRAAGSWTPDELARATAACYATDRALKSTTISDERGTIASMLLSMGFRRAA